MHKTDGTRDGIDCGIDRFQRFYEWFFYGKVQTRVLHVFRAMKKPCKMPASTL